MPATLNVAQTSPKPVSVLWLSAAENVPDHGHEEFIQFAAQFGCTIDFIRLVPPVTGTQFAALLQTADALMVIFHDSVREPEFRGAVVAAVQGGKRLLALGANVELNPLLLEFDLAVTEDRLCDPTTFTDDERTLFIRSPRDGGHPVAHALFESAPITTVGSPARVWYGGSALPLLKACEEARLLNTGDFFEPAGPRLLCCGGLWPIEAKAGEGVLLIGGNCLRNPFVGPTGKFFPGIRANIALAEAIIGWLRGELEPTAPLGLALERMHAIEVSLHDIVVTLLKRHFTANVDAWWYEGIPDGMRKRAAELSEDSKGKIPKEDGFYFISYRQIIEENWALFAPHFEQEKQGKKSLRWMQPLNDLRNRLSHPLRVRKEPVTATEMAEIGARHGFISQIFHTLEIAPG